MLEINPNQPLRLLPQIANDLFNKYIIRVNDNFYRLLEVEFYYNDAELHNDTYTHGHKWQKRSGYWYVHGSGIDIAIGNEQATGGILLRSIERLNPKPTDKKEQYTFGPLNVLTGCTYFKDGLTCSNTLFHTVDREGIIAITGINGNGNNWFIIEQVRCPYKTLFYIILSFRFHTNSASNNDRFARFNCVHK